MVVFFNFMGLGWLIAGIGAAIGLQNIHLLVQADGKYFGTVAGLTIIVLDVAYRLFVTKPRLAKAAGPDAPNRDLRSHWLVGPSVAGSLMFLPAWSVGLIALVLGYVLG